MESPSGTLKKIWLKRFRLGPMDERQAAVLEAGLGLKGNANRGGRRQVTLLDIAAWREAVGDLKADVDPSARRANLLLEGLSLTHSRGRRLNIGEALIVIHGETRPCERMDAAQPGLREALQPAWRAGAYGEVIRGGRIRVGDRAEWVEKGEGEG